MFNFDKIFKKFVDKSFEVTHLDTRTDLKQKDKAIIRKIGYKVMPFMLQIVTFITLLFVLTTIRKWQGFEVAVLAGMAMVILRVSK